MALNRLFFAALLVLGATAVHAQVLPPDSPGSAGFNPRQVAVGTAPSGRVLSLVTSDGSNSVTQLYKGNVISQIDVGSRSWDVAFVGFGTAVVSLLDTDGIAVLRIDVASDMWVLDQIYSIPGINLMQSTRLLPVSGTQRVLVANRGAAPSGAEPWQNAVYELEVPVMSGAPTLVRSFVTESEPSAMAISPDGSRLFVASMQGSFGGPGLATDSPLADGLYDGGTIVMYDFQPRAIQPLLRFQIGSPVRDLAVWMPELGDGMVADYYRLFFTHVGAGAASEDPEFGGRRIPNVVSDIDFGLLDNVARSRRDVVLSHCPDGPSVGDCAAMHVLPEDLLLVDTIAGQDLYVTFSGSGNVAIIELEEDGRIPVLPGGAIADMVSGSFGGGLPRQLGEAGWDPVAQRFDPDVPATGTVGFAFEQADLSRVVTHAVGSNGGVFGSSNPRGMAWNSIQDEVVVVARLGQSLEHIGVAARNYPARASASVFDPGTVDPLVMDGMRRFFATGGGFDFREEQDGADLVENITCGTCHPNERTDGKVRDTRTRQALKLVGPVTFQLPVAVPSVLDVGLTEWLFFEGLHTIIDNAADNPACTYCGTNDFFLNTRAFTRKPRSPKSPYAPDGRIHGPAQAGRWWFDAMNCSRCHNGELSPFTRALVPVGSPGGPLELLDVRAKRLLHDGTQAFVSGSPGSLEEGVGTALRNMTNVGTRVGTEPFDTNTLDSVDAGPPGVNTPALADGWRNGPYLHDGRYRSFEEVLDHTWVIPANGNRAAPHWSAGTNADNYANFLGPNASVLGFPLEGLDEPFGSHQHQRGAFEWDSVSEYLGARPSYDGSGSALDDLLAFLRSVSAETDLCDGSVEVTPVVGGLRVLPVGPGQYQVFWETNVPVRCEIVVTGSNGSPLWSRSAVAAQPGYEHSTPLLTLPRNQRYLATVTVARPDGVCSAGTPVVATFRWKDSKIFFAKAGEERPLPDRSSLGGVHPNPFNPRTTIEFAVAHDADVQVVVYDARGRRVATLVDEFLIAGWNHVVWEGTDTTGRQVSSGVYHVQIRAGQDTDVQRIALVR